MSEFVSHEEAMRQLGLSADELSDLVVGGELRAIRDGDEIRFKADDIAGLRRSRETEPTIVLSDTQAEELTLPSEVPIDLDALSTDETVLNIEGLLEDETEGTTPIPGADLLENDLLESDEISIGSVGDDTVLDTEDLDLDGDFDLTDDDTLLADDDDSLIAPGSARRVQMVRKRSHGWATGVLALTALIALAPCAILLNSLYVDGGQYPFADDSLLFSLNSLVEGILGMF